MKKKIFITVALLAFTSVTDQLFAQNQKAAQGQHIKKATLLVCRITQSDVGCVIAFESDTKSPRDAASGLATGKRQSSSKPTTKFFEVSSSNNAVSEVKGPKGTSSGQTIGNKGRENKIAVISVSHEIVKGPTVSPDKPVSGRSSSDSALSEIAIDEPGVHKMSMQDMHFTMRCAGKTTQIDCVDGVCEIPVGECPNGACSVIASWSWGSSNTGNYTLGSGATATGLSSCSVDFLLEIEDGACTAMAINEKGLPGEKKPNTKTSNNPK